MRRVPSGSTTSDRSGTTESRSRVAAAVRARRADPFTTRARRFTEITRPANRILRTWPRFECSSRRKERLVRWRGGIRGVGRDAARAAGFEASS